MKNKYRKAWPLFLIPLCLPLFLGVLQQWREAKIFRSNGGGFSTAKTGERSAIIGISYYLNKMPAVKRIAVTWTVTDSTKGLYGSTNFYELEFDRRSNTLIYRAHPKDKNFDVDWPVVRIYKNVEEEDIHRVAAKVKTIKAMENYKGGDIEELKKYGLQPASK